MTDRDMRKAKGMIMTEIDDGRRVFVRDGEMDDCWC